jgi:hypothetical protein
MAEILTSVFLAGRRNRPCRRSVGYRAGAANLTSEFLKVSGVLLGVWLFGDFQYAVASDPRDEWADNVPLDHNLAMSNCRGDHRCEDDLNVALKDCISIHRKDGRDAVYSCQYRYMARLGVRPPMRGTDGQWVNGNQSANSSFLKQYLPCLNIPIPSDVDSKERQAAIDAVTACLARDPPE